MCALKSALTSQAQTQHQPPVLPSSPPKLPVLDLRYGVSIDRGESSEIQTAGPADSDVPVCGIASPSENATWETLLSTLPQSNQVRACNKSSVLAQTIDWPHHVHNC